ncbi:chromosome partitioning protein [Dactylosporangium sp. NPDC005555]|uniref:chromosome partitioning protein n=1 Tax=Dactylosporangium sp. NPDC005555 TaxID=3154889 RepID=UPI0033BBD21D
MEVVVTGLELVAGWLAMYAWGKVRRAAGRADAEVDRLVDHGLDRLHDLVSEKLSGDSALERLESEAGRDTAQVEVSNRTRQRVELALREAVEDSPKFAAELWPLIAGLQAATPQMYIASNTGDATASDGGVAVTGVVVGDLSTGH